MKILFLTLSEITDVNERGIYTDLVQKLGHEGHSVTIVNPSERRNKSITRIIESDHIRLLKVKTLNLQKTGIAEKALGFLLWERTLIRAVEKYLGNESFDLILYSTPPITISRFIRKMKERYGATTYLLLKDIFPQNAVDLQMIRKNGFFYKYMRRKEKALYQLSDHIGCMSPANIEYLLDNNPEINPAKVELCPNSILPARGQISVEERQRIREQYGIPIDKTVFIFGGNMGKPQGIGFLLEVLESNLTKENVFFLIIGNGTEYHKVAKWFTKHKPMNASLIPSLPKKEYDKLVAMGDVGMIFLDKRFTIPNYPSRMLSYMENRLPVIMATDLHTDLGKIAEDNGYGLWCKSGDLATFNSFISELSGNVELRKALGARANGYLLENYTVEASAKKILEKLETPMK